MTYRDYQGFTLNTIWVIIVVNLLMLIFRSIIGIDVFSFDGISIRAFKVDYYLGLMPIALSERPWTIVTNLFIHADFWHLVVNMLTFYFFGTYLSRLVGQGRFLLVYFGGGILGNIFYKLMGEPISIAVGASGAVFALAGVLVVMMPRLKVFIFPIPVPLQLWVAVIGIFVILSVFGISNIMPIAWEAHLGGLVAGLIAGYFFRKRERYYYFR